MKACSPAWTDNRAIEVAVAAGSATGDPIRQEGLQSPKGACGICRRGIAAARGAITSPACFLGGLPSRLEMPMRKLGPCQNCLGSSSG